MKFIQHIPNSVSKELSTYEYKDTEDLLSSDLVSWVKGGFRAGSQLIPFHKFTQSRDGDKVLLMAEFAEGKIWWVVGSTEHDLGLPQWDRTDNFK